GPQADIAQGVIVQSDGRILVAGSGGQCEGNSCVVATRLMTDGTLDQSFGQRGLVVTGVAMTVTRVLTQADGKLVFSGATPTSNFAIARMNSDGTMDTRFGGAGGTAGVAIIDFGQGSAIVRGLAIDAYGRILAAGDSGSPSTLALVRLWP